MRDFVLKNKKIVLLLAGCLIGVAGVFLFARHQWKIQKEITYKCADQKTLNVVYYRNSVVIGDKKEKVLLKKNLSNGEASQYVSKINDMKFWTNGKFVMVEQGDTIPYYDCSVEGPTGDGLQNPTIDIPADQIQVAPK